MTKRLQKVIAVFLALITLSSFTSVIAFAEEESSSEPVSTEVTTEPEEDKEDPLVTAGTFVSKIADFVYDFLCFLHDQYKTFCLKDGEEDPYAYFFEGDFGLNYIIDFLQNGKTGEALK